MQVVNGPCNQFGNYVITDLKQFCADNNLVILTTTNPNIRYRNIKPYPSSKVVARVVPPKKVIAKSNRSKMITSVPSSSKVIPSNPKVPKVPAPSTSDDTKMTLKDASSDSKRKRVFSKELRCMLYGFGDHQDSYTETIDLVEDLVMKFLTDVTMRAYNFGANDRVSVQDLMFVLRKDAKKFSRLKELMEMNHELREARKAFDEVNFAELPE